MCVLIYACMTLTLTHDLGTRPWLDFCTKNGKFVCQDFQMYRARTRHTRERWETDKQMRSNALPRWIRAGDNNETDDDDDDDDMLTVIETTTSDHLETIITLDQCMKLSNICQRLISVTSTLWTRYWVWWQLITPNQKAFLEGGIRRSHDAA